MTAIKFFLKERILKGFEISGHTGYAHEGEDIVCAAVSSASQMAVNTITDVLHEEALVDCSDGYLKCVVLEPGKEVLDILEGLKIHLTQISDQYPGFVKIYYGGIQNA